MDDGRGLGIECPPPPLGAIDRRERRARWASLQDAVRAIEATWGGLRDMVLDPNGHGFEISLTDANYGYPDDMLANDVKLDMWEVFMLLGVLTDRYEKHVAEAEGGVWEWRFTDGFTWWSCDRSAADVMAGIPNRYEVRLQEAVDG